MRVRVRIRVRVRVRVGVITAVVAVAVVAPIAARPVASERRDDPSLRVEQQRGHGLQQLIQAGEAKGLEVEARAVGSLVALR